MHEPIRDYLEDYLLGVLGDSRLREVEQHLATCPNCRTEVEQMRVQALLMRALRAPEGIEPAPAFYSRVINSVEAQTRLSIWSVFLDPVFGKRLMYSTMAILVLLSTYLVTTQPAAPAYADATPEMILVEQRPTVGADQQRDRDVILVNLATYNE